MKQNPWHARLKDFLKTTKLRNSFFGTKVLSFRSQPEHRTSKEVQTKDENRVLPLCHWFCTSGAFFQVNEEHTQQQGSGSCAPYGVSNFKQLTWISIPFYRNRFGLSKLQLVTYFKPTISDLGIEYSFIETPNVRKSRIQRNFLIIKNKKNNYVIYKLIP